MTAAISNCTHITVPSMTHTFFLDLETVAYKVIELLQFLGYIGQLLHVMHGYNH